MKNKKGFTLIEILGVLIILALILLLTFPKIFGQIKKIKGDISEKEKALILDAIKDYEHDNVDAPKWISVNTLKKEGYLPNIDLNGYVGKDNEGNLNILDLSTLPTLRITSSSASQFLGHSLTKSNVESITIVDSKTVPAGVKDSWDASSTGNGSIMAYTMDSDSNSKYELYIGGDGGIQANASSNNLFNNFINVTSITGLNNLYTDNVTNMNGMFRSCYKLTSLDLSNFNTTNVQNMGSMFQDCRALTSLDLSNFNTANVQSMNSMFRNSYLLTSLDLSSFITSSLTTMSYMFYDCTFLESINLSSFNTSIVTNMSYMFCYCSNLTSLNLGNNFNTSSVTNMSNMFNDCNKLTTMINIQTTSATYTNMFSYAATEPGAKITVNYTSASESLVDSMIATKTSGSNVVKGSLIS